jgi:hypothetical protein
MPGILTRLIGGDLAALAADPAGALAADCQQPAAAADIVEDAFRSWQARR